jgi:serine/threonine protein kinase/Tfp pilus assembly protein PilF
MIGKTVSHYRILEKLGEGGMGIVYKAEDTKLKRTVALKFLPPGLTRDPQAKERFLHEAQAAAALEHQHICNIYEIDETEDQIFIVMSCFEGQTLKEKIESGPLKIDEALKIAVQAAEGLQAAHEKGIVHRDIKSENIMMNEKSQVKIMDFGLAKLKGQTKITKEGSTLGTAAYMSPEQAQGADVDHRTDIWSLGVVLYEMITGQLPFKGEYEQAIMYSIMNEESEPVTALRTGVPMELERIVNKTLAKDPSERYQGTADLLVDLKKLKRDSDPGMLSTEYKTKKSTVKPMRRFLIPGSILLTVLIIVSGFFIFKRNREASKPDDVVDSIAVLSFENLTGDSMLDYLSDGIAQGISNRLSQLSQLKKVINSSSLRKYKRKNFDARTIAKEVNVKSLISGSMALLEDKVVVNFQIVNGRDSSILWGDKLFCQKASVYEIEELITKEIVKKLGVRLNKNEKNRTTKRYTENVEAYNLYKKGRYFWNKRTEEGLNKAIEYFERAAKKDRNYSLAYTGLADCYNLLPWYGDWEPGESYLKAMYYAGKAVELDYSLAEAHTSIGAIKMHYDWDCETAEEEFKLAIKNNPNYATAHHWYGGLLAQLKQFDKAIVEIKRALELDPLSLIINLNYGDYLYYMRKYDKAVEQYKKTLEIDPNFKLANEWLGKTYLKKGMLEEAILEYKKAESPDLVYAYFISGKKDKALAKYEEWIKKSKLTRTDPVKLAIVHLGVGNIDLALEALEIAYQGRYPRLLDFISDPFSDILRTNQKFKELVKKMGLDI